MDESRLERSLRHLGETVEFPPTPDLTSAVRASIEVGVRPGPLRRARPWLARPVLAGAVALALVATAVLALSPGARTAVADFLGVNGIRIERTDELPRTGLGTPLDLGERTDLIAAQAAVDFRILVPSDEEAGPPSEIYLDLKRGLDRPIGFVSFVWSERPGFPAARETGVGLLITQFEATIDEALIKKVAAMGTDVRLTDINGEMAYWIEGKHDLHLRDFEGALAVTAPRLAANTLVWQAGEVTLRLEGDVSMAIARRIAEGLR